MNILSLLRPLLVVSFLSATTANGQILVELGYFPFNGIFAISGFDDFMLTGAGHVVDVTDPYAPQLVGSVSVGSGSSVVVDGQYGYFGTGMVATVKVVDLSIPSAPIITGTLTLPNSSGVFGLAVSGDVLYAANAQQGLASIDISEPSMPTLIQQLPLSSAQQARGVVVHGSYAYVAEGSGLLIIDISDPADMHVIGGLGEGFVSVAISEDDTRLAAGRSGGGANVFDLADPASPQVIYDVPGSQGTAHTVQILAGNLYMSAEQFGVRVYSMGDLGATELGAFDNSPNGQTFGAYASGELIFVAGLVNGAAVVGWGTVGVNVEPSGSVPLSCYPVPARNTLRWSGSHNVKYSGVKVIDTSGRCVLSARSVDGTIDISSLSTGPYVLAMVYGEAVMATARFLKEE
ncbi:MAG: T9SS type A sorting domain-containing protein [Flavobacteriales bacterium]|nr:T9SS type A sorting domain-containing protein [Flavobacteriales bacterium]